MTLLLTSFTTWLSHHKSNSSDDLLKIVVNKNNSKYYFLRQLPVDTDLASQQVIKTIDIMQPKGIICCGMAESRELLTIESQANCDNYYLKTNINLESLISQLSYTLRSDDAGNFVCEGLYYNLLNYLKKNNLNIPCIFVHVPILTSTNRYTIVRDFQIILNYFS